MPRHKIHARDEMGGFPKKRKSQKGNKGEVRKRYRYRPGTVALREIRKYQTSTETLIPKRSFQRLVKEVMENECRERDILPKKVTSECLLALQCSTEQYVTELFQQSQRAAFHGKRITIQPKDMKIVIDFRDDHRTFHKRTEDSELRSLLPELYVPTFASQTYVGKDPNHIQK